MLLAALPVVIASVLGNLATMPQIPGWYASLAKPSFNPPNWIFGPVWTALYALMIFAFYRVLRMPAQMPLRARAIKLFVVQIALNAAWSWAFFWGQNPAAGFVVVIAFWIMVAVTMVAFWRLDTVSGLCFVPYLAWVSFAAILNAAIWRLN